MEENKAEINTMPDIEYDGCSGGLSKIWRKVTGEIPPFEYACHIHDLYYALNNLRGGGTRGDKKKVDADLLVNIAKCGYPLWAVGIYTVIRIWTLFSWILGTILPFTRKYVRYWKYAKTTPKVQFPGNAYTGIYWEELEKQFFKLKKEKLCQLR